MQPNILEEKSALTIALQHAGLAEDKIVELEIELDDDTYEIEFLTDTREYEYEIDAQTGEITECEFGEDFYAIPEVHAGHIGRAVAKYIARLHAGLSDQPTYGWDVEYERKKGEPTYDVEFRCGEEKYECRVHAFTGVVLYFSHKS